MDKTADEATQVIQKVFQQFKRSESLGDDSSELDAAFQRTRALVETTQRNESQCNICLDDIPASGATWSCRSCFALFDLRCIQSWSKSCRTAQSASFIPKNDEWYCPSCRFSYAGEDVPDQYTCYCHAVINPPLDRWLTPHSCGGQCNAALDCGHSCSLLCHPGPHPLCALTVEATCFCGSETARKRCIRSKFSCGRTCDSVLECREHRCPLPCHEGACPPCTNSSKQTCACGRVTTIRPCVEQGAFRCETVCKKALDCGRHTCEKICCQGDCGTCPLNGERKCPCGKETYRLSCDQPTPVCGSTCNRWLSCGEHRCPRLCHLNSCGDCSQVISLQCRCGAKSKSQPCGTKEWKCDIRCNELRSCGRHKCRKRCCTGAGDFAASSTSASSSSSSSSTSCPRCEEICGKTLTCGNHRCELLCHAGPCQRCPGVAVIACSCGKTTRKVMCGQERTAPTPKCVRPCERPSQCHHTNDEKKKHPCHPDTIPCPPCTLTCTRPQPNHDPAAACTHTCQAKCHDPPPSEVEANAANKAKSDAPLWPAVADKNKTISSTASSTSTRSSSDSSSDPYECPPCSATVTRTCLGGHESRSMKCSEPVRFQCQQPCGQQLRCGNHTCLLPCHELKSVPSQTKGYEVSVASGCQQCTSVCTRPRTGLRRPCTHGCPFGCHSTACPPCEALTELRCPCPRSQPTMIKCQEYTMMTEEELDQTRRCDQRCTLRLKACGHTCPNICCTQCPSGSECDKKLTLKCACGTKRLEAICSEVQRMELPASTSGKPLLSCDDECTSAKIQPQRQTSANKSNESDSALPPLSTPPISQSTTQPIKRATSKSATTSSTSAKKFSSSASTTTSTSASTTASSVVSSAAFKFFSSSSLFARLSRGIKLTDRQVEAALSYVIYIVVVLLVAILSYVLLVM